MTHNFEELCLKHELNDDATKDFKELYEEICKTFVKNLKVSGPKEAKEATVEEMCSATKKDGDPCTFKAKENGLCGRHQSGGKKLPKKKHPCSSQGCKSQGTVEVDGDFFCKRHSD